MNILDTKIIYEKEINKVKNIINNYLVKPKIAIININATKEINSFNLRIKKLCDYIGCIYKIYNYTNIEEKDLLLLLDKLNKDYTITGIILSLPIPNYINKYNIYNSIIWKKDIEGISSSNKLKLIYDEDYTLSSVSLGVMKLIKYYNIDVRGKNVVIINRSDLIGKSLFYELIKKDATISICHSKTKNLNNYIANADIIITATGNPGIVKSDMVKEKSIIIDLGISYHNGKLVGDFINNVDKNITLINNMGNMTMVGLAENIMKCYYINNIN